MHANNASKGRPCGVSTNARRLTMQAACTVPKGKRHSPTRWNASARISSARRDWVSLTRNRAPSATGLSDAEKTWTSCYKPALSAAMSRRDIITISSATDCSFPSATAVAMSWALQPVTCRAKMNASTSIPRKAPPTTRKSPCSALTPHGGKPHERNSSFVWRVLPMWHACTLSAFTMLSHRSAGHGPGSSWLSSARLRTASASSMMLTRPSRVMITGLASSM